MNGGYGVIWWRVERICWDCELGLRGIWLGYGGGVGWRCLNIMIIINIYWMRCGLWLRLLRLWFFIKLLRLLMKE